MESVETTNIVICGCGPTGAMLSAMLGRLGVHNIVLDREPGITTDPRGIALDEEGIRLLQSLGLYEATCKEIGSCMGKFNFVGGIHNNLTANPFLTMDYSTSEGGTGHVGFICHKQPILEKHLRSAMDKTSKCDLRVSSTVTSISEDDDWVYTSYTTADGSQKTVRSKFTVGADGKTGFVRKKYLEPRGVILQQASLTSYKEVWVALNWQLSLPTPDTHPRFPLWSLGYTPEQVYDLFFPCDFRFLCNPERPAVCGRFGLPDDRLWRFEFVVKKDEDGNNMSSPEMIEKVVWPYITHPGSRYGLKEPVRFPQDCINSLRSRPFTFSARSANIWALNRVILAGDSAHVFPPFGGQGIASGFRDASALAWRLALLTGRPSPSFRSQINHEPVLKAWYLERKQQLNRSIAATVANGAFVTESNPMKIFVRDWWLWFQNLIPSWRRWHEAGPRRDGMVCYLWNDDLAFLPTGGMCFPQVYCRDVMVLNAGLRFTDDVIFAPEKKASFQIVVLLDRVDEVEDARMNLARLDALSGGLASGDEATFVVHDIAAPSPIDLKLDGLQSVVRVATGGEFAADEKMCGGRPEPKYYNELRIKRDMQGWKYIILRQDRFVFATCADREGLERAVGEITRILGIDS
ncbi:hypothetical protein LTR62_001674 [Meristemomyces frigidus]|uniref:FAD-binding domain-containing protein n=1 Tax=Meristemomyces frigidus TaxID=1508187 RepID=A0AAN7T800_9PEZI|nr:hypothetical protein LTR62_001674 [Meristemomyces frigidus]